MALAAVAIEQDTAYWEVHIERVDEGSVEAMFGVATKKDRKFYIALEELEEGKHSKLANYRRNLLLANIANNLHLLSDSPETNGTALMSKIKVSNGDIVGVCVQQSDLPMVQLFLNGEPLSDRSVNRFRGTVYPSVFLPENEGLSLRIVFNDTDFKKSPPSSRFSPVMVARGLV